MSLLAWSIVSAGASLGGLWLAGHEPRWGWWWGIPCQGVWAAYGWFTGQYGMIGLSVAFTIIYVRNLLRNRGASYRHQTATLDGLRAERDRLQAELDDCRAPATVGVR